MRWAIIGAVGTDSFEFHLQDTLHHMGHDVKIFDLTLGAYRQREAHYWMHKVSATYDKSMAKKLAENILRYEPDIVLGVYRHIHPYTIEYIKRVNPNLSAIHVNQDNLCTLGRQQVLVSAYDVWFSKDPYMVRTFRDKAGLNIHYLPESFNPRYHAPPSIDRKKSENKTNIDILVFGTIYPFRSCFIEGIKAVHKNIKVYGSQGPFMSPGVKSIFGNKQILTTEKSNLIYSSRIVLNNFFYGEIDSVNCKYFEINGCAGFQLCDYKEVLKEYSPINPFQYTFNSIAEANDLIAYYLPRQEERYAIADANFQYFLNHHTYEHRIKSILEVLGK